MRWAMLSGVHLFLVGVLQKLLGDALRIDAGRHEIVALVTEYAYDFRGQCFVEQSDHNLSVGLVSRSHRALLDVLPCAFS